MPKAWRYSRNLFALVRVDEYWADVPPDDYGPTLRVSYRFIVKEVVDDLLYAERECERLNQLNGGKGSRYFVQTTRLLELKDE